MLDAWNVKEANTYGEKYRLESANNPWVWLDNKSTEPKMSNFGENIKFVTEKCIEHLQNHSSYSQTYFSHFVPSWYFGDWLSAWAGMAGDVNEKGQSNNPYLNVLYDLIYKREFQLDSVNIDFFYFYNRTIQSTKDSLYENGPVIPGSEHEWPYWAFAPHGDFANCAMKEIIISSMDTWNFLQNDDALYVMIKPLEYYFTVVKRKTSSNY